jgi:hypothetical protein
MARRRDDEDDDDRPRSRRPREDDDEDEPRPRRKSRPVEDDDEDDRPRRRARTRDEEDEDDRPRRRKPKPAGMSKGLLFGLIGGGVALLLLVVLLVVFLGGDGTVGGPPKAVFEAYAKELKSGNKDRAVKYLAAVGRFELESDARAAGLRPGDQLAHEVTGTRWLSESFTVSEEKIDPSGLKARLTLRFDGAKNPFGQDTMEVDLVKEGSKWKIDF